MSSRSFGQRVESLQELEEAISYHAANAAQRLRKESLFASAISVFIQNSPFDQDEFYGKPRSLPCPHLRNAACKSPMPHCGY
jgi:DNA polymerase V